MRDDAASRLDTLEMAISDTFEERFPGRESPGDALDKFCALMDNLQQVKFCRGCIRTEEKVCRIHVARFPMIGYVDTMTTLELLDHQLGELTADVAVLSGLKRPESEVA